MMSWIEECQAVAKAGAGEMQEARAREKRKKN
jgi:hypothetical protein